MRLESFFVQSLGLVSKKNEVNIMVKNAIDVIYGGLSYWLYGFAFSFGLEKGTNGFCGIGKIIKLIMNCHYKTANKIV